MSFVSVVYTERVRPKTEHECVRSVSTENLRPHSAAPGTHAERVENKKYFFFPIDGNRTRTETEREPRTEREPTENWTPTRVCPGGWMAYPYPVPTCIHVHVCVVYVLCCVRVSRVQQVDRREPNRLRPGRGEERGEE